jgi:hypothetical protein
VIYNNKYVCVYIYIFKPYITSHHIPFHSTPYHTIHIYIYTMYNVQSKYMMLNCLLPMCHEKPNSLILRSDPMIPCPVLPPSWVLKARLRPRPQYSPGQRWRCWKPCSWHHRPSRPDPGPGCHVAF